MMVQWKIKELSKLTGASVRTLHHYDKLGLLKPSGRTQSGYRWYSENDLVRLQQIMSLKYFGFSLKQIKTMLKQTPDIFEHLKTQQKMIQDQAEHLGRVQDAITKVLETTSFDWNTLILLIERYKMIDELKNTWFEKLSDKQKDSYLKFKQDCLKEVSAWEDAINQINSGKLSDPEGSDGKRIIDIFLKMQKAQTGWEAKVKEKMRMTRADSNEMMETINTFIKVEGVPFTAEGRIWFAKAFNAHKVRVWKKLYENILKNLDSDPASAKAKKIADKWRALLAEQCPGATTEFYLGTHLLLDLAKGSSALKNEQLTQEVMAKNFALLQDPLAMEWISRALKVS